VDFRRSSPATHTRQTRSIAPGFCAFLGLLVHTSARESLHAYTVSVECSVVLGRKDHSRRLGLVRKLELLVMRRVVSSARRLVVFGAGSLERIRPPRLTVHVFSVTTVQILAPGAQRMPPFLRSLLAVTALQGMGSCAGDGSAASPPWPAVSKTCFGRGHDVRRGGLLSPMRVGRGCGRGGVKVPVGRWFHVGIHPRGRSRGVGERVAALGRRLGRSGRGDDHFRDRGDLGRVVWVCVRVWNR
jgi:hypothetical protein